MAVEVFTMLADATRVRIILALHDTEMSVGQLAEATGRPQPSVSQHLAKLRLSRIVAVRHEGSHAYYRLVDEHAQRLVTNAIHQAEHTLKGDGVHLP